MSVYELFKIATQQYLGQLIMPKGRGGVRMFYLR